jgi:hypothetical protein
MVSYRARAKRCTVLVRSKSCRTLLARHWGGRTLQSNKRVIEFHFSFFFSFIKLQVNKKLKRSSWNDIQITLPVTVLKNLAKQTKKYKKHWLDFLNQFTSSKSQTQKEKISQLKQILTKVKDCLEFHEETYMQILPFSRKSNIKTVIQRILPKTFIRRKNQMTRKKIQIKNKKSYNEKSKRLNRIFALVSTHFIKWSDN